jgi:hypothetical protein
MGQVKDQFEYFLINGGRDLGFDSKCCPEYKDLNTVLKERVPIWQYYGFKSQEEYWDAECDNSEPLEA